MKIVTYNVNGLRPRISQFGSLSSLLDSLDADIICFQETKLSRQDLRADLVRAEGYESFFSCTRTSDKGRSAGYSGLFPLLSPFIMYIHHLPKFHSVSQFYIVHLSNSVLDFTGYAILRLLKRLAHTPLLLACKPIAVLNVVIIKYFIKLKLLLKLKLLRFLGCYASQTEYIEY